MVNQILKIKPIGAITYCEITPVDLKKAKIRFINFHPDEPIRAYFDDETHVVLEGGISEVEIEVYEV